MKEESKVRSKFIKDSLLDYEKLTSELKEGTTNAVRDLLSETVRDTYNKILMEKEDDEPEYEEEEVEDTSVASGDDESDDAEESDEDVLASDEDTDESPEDDEEAVDTDVLDDGNEVDVVSSGEDGDGTEWAEFDKYKIGDDEYDFSEAEDDEIVKVYKLLKDDDQIMVKKEDGMLNIKDGETGAEYLVLLDDEDGDEGDELEFDVLEDNDFEKQNEEDMKNESRIYEVVMEDNNMGYTDSYQKQDVMTNPGMSEPGKNVNDWDAGVPKGSEKPWSGYPGKKKRADKPFNEEDDMMSDDMGDFDLEEATNVGGFVQQNSTSKSHIPNSNGRKARSASKNGRRVKGTTKPRYSAEEEDVNESIASKAQKIFKENKELKVALGKFRNVLQEAAVTNVNLGKIIKLISENATTQDEKLEIIKRFGKEAKTLKDSERLYESISSELSRKPKMNITESRNIENGPIKINETTIYKSKDMMDSLELMHKLCK